MGDQIERTAEAQRHFDTLTGPMRVINTKQDHPTGLAPDPFKDDEPLACGVENPDQCESCS